MAFVEEIKFLGQIIMSLSNYFSLMWLAYLVVIKTSGWYNETIKLIAMEFKKLAI